jgi:hypothetical protein
MQEQLPSAYLSFGVIATEGSQGTHSVPYKLVPTRRVVTHCQTRQRHETRRWRVVTAFPRSTWEREGVRFPLRRKRTYRSC